MRSSPRLTLSPYLCVWVLWLTRFLFCVCRTLKLLWTLLWTSCGSWRGKAASSTRQMSSSTPWSLWKPLQWWPPPPNPPALCTLRSSRTLNQLSSAAPAPPATSPAPSGQWSRSKWPPRWNLQRPGPSLQFSPNQTPRALALPPLHLSSLLTSPVLSDKLDAALWISLCCFGWRDCAKRHHDSYLTNFWTSAEG